MMRQVLAAIAAAALLAPASVARASEESPMAVPAGCAAPTGMMSLGTFLTRSGGRIRNGEGLTIVAVGSSSTEGVGASTPALNYPNLLQAELKERYPRIPVRVLNRGKGGEDAAEEFARLERDVIAERPDLVIWQVGTNAVLRRDDPKADGELIEKGVDLLKAAGADIVLMDMQDAPRVVSRPAFDEMEQVLARVAKASKIGLFRRFDIMRHWRAAQPTGAPPMIGPDGLHMTDRGYGCLAAGLADALASNWTAQAKPATASQVATIGAKHY